MMKFEKNHIYIGNDDKLQLWSGHKDEIVDAQELSSEEQIKAIAKVRELILKSATLLQVCS